MAKVILITGATQSGKTRLAIQIAQKTDALIIPIDQLQMYKHLVHGVGLDKKGLETVRSVGYQILDPWERLSPSKYVMWLRSKLLEYKDEELIIIEGGCTSYLKEVFRKSFNDPVLKTINFIAIDSEDNYNSRHRYISSIATNPIITEIIEEVRAIGKKGYYNSSGLKLFRKCEHKFVHPEYSHPGLAWAIRISAGIYYPAHLALTSEISFENAKSRIIYNVVRIQTYQKYRINNILNKNLISNYENAKIKLNKIALLKKAA